MNCETQNNKREPKKYARFESISNHASEIIKQYLDKITYYLARANEVFDKSVPNLIEKLIGNSKDEYNKIFD